MSTKVAKIIDHPDLRKIDDAYVVNTNRAQYEAAKVRKRNMERLSNLEEKVTSMEQKLENIIELLQGLSK